MRVSPIICALVLAGCQQSPGTHGTPDANPDPAPAGPLSSNPIPAPTPTSSVSGMNAIGPVASLKGEWRVAGIDGEPFDEPYGLALSGSGDELWWEPRCAGHARRYRIEAMSIEFYPSRASGPPSPPGSPPPPVCAIGIPSKLPDVIRALDAATRVGRTSENGVLISGRGRSVLLFSQ